MKKFKRIKPGKKNDERIISNNSSKPENEVKNPKSNHIQFLQKSLGNHATLRQQRVITNKLLSMQTKVLVNRFL